MVAWEGTDLGWAWEKGGDGGMKVVCGEERNPSWFYSCKLHCSNCCSSLQNKKNDDLGGGIPPGISGTEQQEHHSPCAARLGSLD